MSTVLNHTPETVFAWLADLEKLPEWEPSFAEVRREGEGPVRAGAAYWCRRNQPTKTETTMVVTEYEPLKKLVIESDWAGFLKPKFGYLVEPTGAGTRLTLFASPRVRGVGRLMAPVIELIGPRLTARYLANLKRLIDGADVSGSRAVGQSGS
ncbi:MAG: SRPBCC family protein [Thermomicrobiales bacterium]